MCELKVAREPLRLGDLERSDALIVFSRKNSLKYKSEIEHLGFRVSIVYGRLGPEVRREQARKFDAEETDVIVSTDAIAMGMNLPIKRIIFSTLTKHIDDETIPITLSEIKQIAGRAGRFKRFPIGEVNCLTKVENGLIQIHEALQTELPQKTQCMVGPDLDIFTQVNSALRNNALPELTLSEFLRLFNTMTFQKPFFCVDLKEMIELAEMVEEADSNKILSIAEIFGLACAPVNLGLLEHVQYYVWILNHFAKEINVDFAPIEPESNDIDYLETSIKCVELYQWLARHFNFKRFEHDEIFLLENKGKAIDKLNKLLSEKIVRTCASCGIALP
ncbi:MAG: helicase-related protein, partial [Bdellovibrionota bacterium]